MNRGWIGVDLDGTLAVYTGWQGEHHIGEPIKPMVKRVKEWLDQGVEVRIFTARVGTTKDDRDISRVRATIESWCFQHIGVALPITNLKDFGMIELWDDRAVQVVKNTGRRVGRTQT